MKIVHNQLKKVKAKKKQITNGATMAEKVAEFDRYMVYKAFKKACLKYADEIAKVQKIIPGWQPAFNYKPQDK